MHCIHSDMITHKVVNRTKDIQKLCREYGAEAIPSPNGFIIRLGEERHLLPTAYHSQRVCYRCGKCIDKWDKAKQALIYSLKDMTDKEKERKKRSDFAKKMWEERESV